MPYDPFKHHRRSIRLHGYDYAQAGAYFVTILTYRRECLLGDIVDGEMRVNALGQIAVECWDALPTHFPNVELDVFVAMSNHVHGVIVIAERDDVPPRKDGVVEACNVGAQHAAPLHDVPRHTNVEPGSLGAIVRSFKSAVTKRINETRDTAGVPVWHRNYYEHIIRDEKSLNAIRQYIDGNPANWTNEEENPINLRHKETMR